MEKNKKTIIICICVLIWLGAMFLLPYTAYRFISKDLVGAQDTAKDSYDSRYTLFVETNGEGKGRLTSFYVKAKGGEAIIFESPTNYKTSALSYIDWKENSLDIIIMSSETGFVTYEHVDGSWQKKAD